MQLNFYYIIVDCCFQLPAFPKETKRARLFLFVQNHPCLRCLSTRRVRFI
uniref:Uncharacterized protein n=1 Tax=Medicago truncatula TaxID=3880 RepID=I3TAR3_MEDTR|nr:unknown [Medicago truncatula]